jgi:outer membrane protein assembly factor BamB
VGEPAIEFLLYRMPVTLIDFGMVVPGSYDGIVIAADVATGAERWRFQAESSFLNSPARVESRAHLADGAGHLYALDAITGEE